MITREYVLTMARYNAWQNKQISPVVQAMDENELIKDRGAFFGSIQATLNHLLWGDQLWMSRFTPTVDAPKVAGTDSVNCCVTIGDWGAERFRLDGRIRLWAERLKTVDLKGDLTWYSGILGRESTTSIAVCITHMFNHQIHHRGQVHAMLTAAGVQAPVTDLIFMPEDV